MFFPWKLRIPLQMNYINKVCTDQKTKQKKNWIGDFDSEESPLFRTALKMEFLDLHLFLTDLDISDFQHAFLQIVSQC